MMAEAGVASRRASESLILAGRVEVNGGIVQELGTKVDPVHDQVVVDGRLIKPHRKIYIALNKPAGYLCTRQDPQRRKTIGDLLPAEWNNLYSVGRLDRDSEGLIFLSNDGDFCLNLTHPRYGVRKTYLVTVPGRVSPALVAKLRQGIHEGGDLLKAHKARILRSNNTQSVVEVQLSEGKNREVRRMFESQGLQVIHLQRVQIGSVKIGELPLGKWRTLTEAEINSLLPSI